MGLKKIWTCEKCGQSREMDPTDISERPPSGWQVIPFDRGASVVPVPLCKNCMAHLYEGFIKHKADAHAGTGGADYRRGVLETFATLANYLDNPELRQIHTFGQQWQDGDFDPGELLLAWVNDPEPVVAKEELC